MTMDTRISVSCAVQDFFGAPVAVSERVSQVLETTYQYGGDNQTYVLLASILRRVPAVSASLIELNLDVFSLLLPPPLFQPNPFLLKDHVKSVLGQAFLKDFFDPKALNLVATRVKQTQRLVVDDLINAPLTSPFNWPDNIPQTMLSSLLIGMGINPLQLTRSDLKHYARRIKYSLKDLHRIDPAVDAQQFVLSWNGKRYTIRPFGVWGAFQLQEEPLPNGSLWIARGNVIERSMLFAEEAVCELEHLINSDANEINFQKFFESHPEFLLALGSYVSIHPQLILHEDNGSRLIPDFFLEKLNSDFCDICDLKRPTADLIRNQKNRIRFRDAVMEGVAQLRVYRDWFEDRHHRSQFRSQYGIDAYRPEVVLIIGRKQSFYDEVERIRVESDLPNWIRLKTYDDVAEKAKHWQRLAATTHNA